jgi:hypothetical protein
MRIAPGANVLKTEADKGRPVPWSSEGFTVTWGLELKAASVRRIHAIVSLNISQWLSKLGDTTRSLMDGANQTRPGVRFLECNKNWTGDSD